MIALYDVVSKYGSHSVICHYLRLSDFKDDKEQEFPSEEALADSKILKYNGTLYVVEFVEALPPISQLPHGYHVRIFDPLTRTGKMLRIDIL